MIANSGKEGRIEQGLAQQATDNRSAAYSNESARLPLSTEEIVIG